MIKLRWRTRDDELGDELGDHAILCVEGKHDYQFSAIAWNDSWVVWASGSSGTPKIAGVSIARVQGGGCGINANMIAASDEIIHQLKAAGIEQAEVRRRKR